MSRFDLIHTIIAIFAVISILFGAYASVVIGQHHIIQLGVLMLILVFVSDIKQKMPN